MMPEQSTTEPRTNIEKLVAFAEEEGAELIPAFLALMEVCFHCEEHRL